jgi:hypothetical protein
VQFLFLLRGSSSIASWTLDLKKELKTSIFVLKVTLRIKDLFRDGFPVYWQSSLHDQTLPDFCRLSSQLGLSCGLWRSEQTLTWSNTQAASQEWLQAPSPAFLRKPETVRKFSFC